MWANGSIGFQGVLFIFAACCFLGFVVSFWVPETKSLTLEEISTLETTDEEKGETVAYKSVATPSVV